MELLNCAEHLQAHVMIDVETLGTCSDAVVLSIGAVKFTLEEKFYTVLNVDEELKTDAKVSASTLLWWLDHKEAKDVAMLSDRGSKPNYDKLMEFLEFISSCEYFWSKGTNFDFPILENCLRRYGLEPSWRYYKLRDFRTLDALYDQALPAPASHNALEDAVAQAKRAVSIVVRNEIVNVSTGAFSASAYALNDAEA